MESVTAHNFIDGQFTPCKGYIDSYNPSTGAPWARVPDSGEVDADLAVQAATQAFSEWSMTPASVRSDYLMKIADILESRLEEFAKIESRDQGKPVGLARTMDIPRAVYNFRFFATSVLHSMNESTHVDAVNALNYTSRMPVGVACLISPWNLPLYLLTFKIAPAIASGNTVVAKPSEMTSVTAWMLCKVLQEAGLPNGVVNMVFGTGPNVGSALVRHPHVSLVSFTGSTATATKIRSDCANLCKKLSLELGGKNACIIYDDADLDDVIPTVIRSSFSNQGEICLCTSRIFVQTALYKTFLQKFVSAARAIKVGDPRDEHTQMGALVSKEHLAKVRGYIKIANEENATIHCGEGVDPLELPEGLSGGYFMRPTVISDTADTSKLMQEEIFGPVTCVVPFVTEEEVIARANSVQYGLCASVWTRNLGRAHRTAKALEVGTVWTNCWLVRDLNMPFGGMKSSGIGREGAKYSLDFFTEAKTVCIKI